jgi:hypothetical protein
MADPTLEAMMRTFLEQQAKIAEDQKQTAARQLRLEQRLAAAASLPDREFVEGAVEKVSKKKARAAAKESHSDRILRLVRKGPLSTTQIMEALDYTESDKGAMWDAISKLERQEDAIVIQRPATNGARGRRGPSIVYHSSHIKLLKPLP